MAGAITTTPPIDGGEPSRMAVELSEKVREILRNNPGALRRRPRLSEYTD